VVLFIFNVCLLFIAFSCATESPTCSIYKLDAKKKIRIEKIDRIFKSLEVVPLFGDMQIAPFNYVKRSKYFDASKWPLCSTVSAISAQADLNKYLPQIRDDHIKYISELARYSNEVRTHCPCFPWDYKGY